MSNEALTTPWLEAAVAQYSNFFTATKTSTAVVLVVTGTPNGDVATTWKLTDGVLSFEEATNADATLTLTMAWKDFSSVATGSLLPTVAYMQGLLKSSGDMKLMLDLLAQAATPAFQSWRATL